MELLVLMMIIGSVFCTFEIEEKPKEMHSYNVLDLQNFESTERQVIEDEYSCKGIKGETYLETKMLQSECKSLMGTGLMQLSLSKLRQMDTIKLFRAKEKHLAKKGGGKRKRSILFAEEEVGCPVVDEEYIRKAGNQINKLSISPYEGNAKYDSHRLPRYVSQDECLCVGCIDPATGRETMDYVSQKISLSQDVFYHANGRWSKKKEIVTIGCTCAVPKN